MPGISNSKNRKQHFLEAACKLLQT